MKIPGSEFWRAVAVALCMCVITAGVSAQVPQPAVDIPPAATSMPGGALVKSDPEMSEWLAKARAAMERKDYPEAVKILQALIEKHDTGFVLADTKENRFLPLRDVALHLLGEIPPEQLDRYRRLYDPKAQRKLHDAVQAGDVRGIRAVADLYRHTSIGCIAVEELGQWYFDHARFSQAGRVWRELLRDDGNGRLPILLLKAATAYHLAGDAQQAKALADVLHAKYPSARATLAGKEQKLTDVLTAYLKICPLPQQAVSVLEHTYPGWGGLPRGQGVMPSANVVLQPNWRFPPRRNGIEQLQAKPGMLGSYTSITLRDGSVSLEVQQANRRYVLSLPPMLRPVVVGNLVMYRDEDRVVAVDTPSGGEPVCAWMSQSLPMERPLPLPNHYSMPGFILPRGSRTDTTASTLCDPGRYSLTVGGGRVYTVFDYPTFVDSIYAHVLHRRTGKPPSSASSLAALSLKGEGKLEWIVGWADTPAEGEESFLHECTFLSVPTYVARSGDAQQGELYVTALHEQTFYAICLDAATGTLRWKSQIGPTPTVRHQRSSLPMRLWSNASMSPPAVANNRVFVTTNTGVTAAYDAQTGQPIWACQYGPSVVDSDSLQRMMLMKSGAKPTEGDLNPLIVSDDILITMPLDSGEVFAHSIADGKLLWRHGRNRYLTSLDAGRISLAGAGVSVLRVKDGKELWRDGVIECLGDPLATTNSLLVSGPGKLWRISLDDYTVTDTPLQADGLLGNLLSIDGKLIAANALGLCAYYDYDKTFASLTERIETASKVDQLELHRQRGELSFSAGRLEEALKDYTAAEELAMELPDSQDNEFLQAQLHRRRYRTCIALGNHERDVVKALTWFEQAKTLARTNQARAHMLIRIAKLLEWGGRFTEAIQAARELSQMYPEEDVVDVRIGPNVDSRQTFGSKDATLPAGGWAKRFIDRIVQIHGSAVSDRKKNVE